MESNKIDSVLADIKKVDSANETKMNSPIFIEEKIHGLGIFKIGETVESTIDKLKTANHYKLDSISTIGEDAHFNANHILATNGFILKINPPGSTLNDVEGLDNSYWDKSISVYKVFTYIVDSLTIKNLYATYYKDKLVEVICDWSLDLKNAIESKFGKPDKEFRDLNQKPFYYTISWYNGDLEANYDTIMKNFCVKIKGGDRFLYGCSDRAFKKQDAVDKAEKKKELKNL